jgi:glutaredoxin
MLTKNQLIQVVTAVSMAIGTFTAPIAQVQAKPSMERTQSVQSNETKPVRYRRSIALGAQVATVSGNAEIALVKHLVAKGVKFYGAFWCSHCQNQKSLFGATAATKLPYIECDKNGENPQRQLCKDKDIRTFPTWDIDGKYVVGTQELKDIAQLTGYTGPTNFKYQKKDIK